MSTAMALFTPSARRPPWIRESACGPSSGKPETSLVAWMSPTCACRVTTCSCLTPRQQFAKSEKWAKGGAAAPNPKTQSRPNTYRPARRLHRRDHEAQEQRQEGGGIEAQREGGGPQEGEGPRSIQLVRVHEGQRLACVFFLFFLLFFSSPSRWKTKKWNWSSARLRRPRRRVGGHTGAEVPEKQSHGY